MDDLPDDVKRNIRSVLLSKAGGVKITNFSKDYNRLVGKRLMYRSYGFTNLTEMLGSLTDVCRIVEGSDGEQRIKGIVDNPDLLLNHTARKARFKGDVSESRPEKSQQFCVSFSRRSELTCENVKNEFGRFGEIAKLDADDSTIYVWYKEKDSAFKAMDSLSQKLDLRLQLVDQQNSSKDAMTTRKGRPLEVYIGNLHMDVDQDDLAALLSDFSIRNIKIREDDDRKKYKFAFAEVDSLEEANNIIDNFDNHELRGRKLKVQLAETSSKGRDERPSMSALNKERKHRPLTSSNNKGRDEKTPMSTITKGRDEKPPMSALNKSSFAMHDTPQRGQHSEANNDNDSVWSDTNSKYSIESSVFHAQRNERTPEVYLGNLHMDIKEDDIAALLADFSIGQIRLNEKDDKKEWKFAFVAVDSMEEAIKIIQIFNNRELRRRILRVKMADKYNAPAAAHLNDMPALEPISDAKQDFNGPFSETQMQESPFRASRQETSDIPPLEPIPGSTREFALDFKGSFPEASRIPAHEPLSTQTPKSAMDVKGDSSDQSFKRSYSGTSKPYNFDNRVLEQKPCPSRDSVKGFKGDFTNKWPKPINTDCSREARSEASEMPVLEPISPKSRAMDFKSDIPNRSQPLKDGSSGLSRSETSDMPVLARISKPSSQCSPIVPKSGPVTSPIEVNPQPSKSEPVSGPSPLEPIPAVSTANVTVKNQHNPNYRAHYSTRGRQGLRGDRPGPNPRFHSGYPSQRPTYRPQQNYGSYGDNRFPHPHAYGPYRQRPPMHRMPFYPGPLMQEPAYNHPNWHMEQFRQPYRHHRPMVPYFPNQYYEHFSHESDMGDYDNDYEEPADNTAQLYIQNIGPETTRNELQALFRDFNPSFIFVATDVPRPHAFAHFAESTEALEAMLKLDGTILRNGNKMVIEHGLQGKQDTELDTTIEIFGNVKICVKNDAGSEGSVQRECSLTENRKQRSAREPNTTTKAPTGVPSSMQPEKLSAILKDCFGNNAGFFSRLPAEMNLIVQSVEDEFFFWGLFVDQSGVMPRVLGWLLEAAQSSASVRAYKPGERRAGVFQDNEYLRVHVESVEGNTATVFFVDWGHGGQVSVSDLRALPDSIWVDGPITLPCRLSKTTRLESPLMEAENIYVKLEQEADHKGIETVTVLSREQNF